MHESTALHLVPGHVLQRTLFCSHPQGPSILLLIGLEREWKNPRAGAGSNRVTWEAPQISEFSVQNGCTLTGS